MPDFTRFGLYWEVYCFTKVLLSGYNYVKVSNFHVIIYLTLSALKGLIPSSWARKTYCIILNLNFSYTGQPRVDERVLSCSHGRDKSTLLRKYSLYGCVSWLRGNGSRRCHGDQTRTRELWRRRCTEMVHLQIQGFHSFTFYLFFG